MAKNCTTGVPARGRCAAEDAHATKSSLAARLRAWMRGRGNREFTPAQAAAGLGLAPGQERQPVGLAFTDFCERGEIERLARGRYKYVRAWRAKPKHKPELIEKLCRAMYVSVNGFGVSDLVKLCAGGVSQDHAQEAVHRLADQGYLRQDGKQHTQAGGVERFWRIVHRDQFHQDFIL